MWWLLYLLLTLLGIYVVLIIISAIIARRLEQALNTMSDAVDKVWQDEANRSESEALSLDVERTQAEQMLREQGFSEDDIKKLNNQRDTEK